jgi:ankyrin repeat protein
MAAAFEGYLSVVNALIEARADLNIVSDDGHTALHAACLNPKNHTTVAALLAAGAMIDVPGTVESPLALCIIHGSSESLKLLVDAGADLNGSMYDRTPLSIATAFSNLAAAKLMLDAKADVNFSSSTSGTIPAIIAAATSGSVEMVKLFVNVGADMKIRDNEGYTCLHRLVLKCHPSGAWLRDDIDIEENPRVSARVNKTPSDLPGVFKVLVEAKAEVSARGPKGDTPLMFAVQVNNIEAMKCLLAAGASATESKDSTSLLMVASAAGSLSAVKALIAAGAEVNQANNDGVTPICFAVSPGHTAIVSALIEAGADVNHVVDFDRYANTPLDVASGPRSRAAVDVLKKAGAVTWVELMEQRNDFVRATAEGDIELVNKLIVSASDKEKECAMKLAVLNNRLPMVKCLLAAGVDPSTVHLGHRVLIWACQHGYLEVAIVLIDAGADYINPDPAGKTPLQYAAKGKHRDVVALLLKKTNEFMKAHQ